MPQPQTLLKPVHPKINWGNPITRGLVFDTPLWENAGTIAEDLAAPLGMPNIGSLGSAAAWERKNYGTDIDFAQTANAVVTFNNTPAQMNNMTVFSVEVMEYYRTSGGDGLGTLIHKLNNVLDASCRFRILHGDNGTDDIGFSVGTATTQGDWSWASGMARSAWYHEVFTYDGRSTANNPTLMQNGVVLSTYFAQSPAGTWATDDTNLYIGKNAAAGTRYYDGKILYVRMWNRLLTTTEQRSLYVNPWQIYTKPNFLPYYIPSPAAGATAYQVTRMMMGMGM